MNLKVWGRAPHCPHASAAYGLVDPLLFQNVLRVGYIETLVSYSVVWNVMCPAEIQY